MSDYKYIGQEDAIIQCDGRNMNPSKWTQEDMVRNVRGNKAIHHLFDGPHKEVTTTPGTESGESTENTEGTESGEGVESGEGTVALSPPKRGNRTPA